MHIDIGGKTGPGFPWLRQIHVKTQNALHRPPGALLIKSFEVFSCDFM